MAKTIALLGSTGSIGTNSLRVVDALGDGYRVAALSAHTSVELLAEQAQKLIGVILPRLANVPQDENRAFAEALNVFYISGN